MIYLLTLVLILLTVQFISCIPIFFSYVLGSKDTKSSSGTKFVSIVLPLRNEKNIVPLLNSLLSQTYSKSDFELILVNDHSEKVIVDDLKHCLEKYAELSVQWLDLDLNQIGKKAALTYGISKAKGVFILSIDGDCVYPRNWMEEIVRKMEHTQADLCIGSVQLSEVRNFVSLFQAMEMFGLRTLTQGSVAMGKPLLCSGANLCFTRSFFEKVDGYSGNQTISSGDDMFLLNKAMDSGARIRGVNSQQSLAYTRPLLSWADYFSQHLRWLSKMKKFPDKRHLVTFGGDLLIRILTITIPIYYVISNDWQLLSLFPISVKFLIDFLLVFLPLIQSRTPRLMAFFPIAFLTTSVVQLVVLFKLLFSGKIEWKGRVINS